MNNEDQDYSDIAKLKEVLAAPIACDEYDTEFENENDYNDDLYDVASISSEGGATTSNIYLDMDDSTLHGLPSSLDVCKGLGTVCIELLFEIESQLTTILENCKTKIKEIQTKIDKIKNPHNKTMNRSSWFYMFGIPYFKDAHYYPSPPNEDQLEKMRNNDLSMVDIPPLRQWKRTDKTDLETAIKTQEISKQIKLMEVRKTSILKQLNNSETLDTATIKELKASIAECSPALIKNKSLAELVGYSMSEYDWMKISVSDLNGVHSADECQAMWFNYLHPMINKSVWTENEDNRLKELVIKYDNQNWDAIAEELGTHRSAYQCMCQYQTRLNDKLRKSKWSKDEDDYLREVVGRCRIGSYIPWAKVTYYIDGRSKNQVFNRWTYSLDPNIKRGRFTENEDILIVAGVRRYGKDFARVAQLLPGRTSTQVRDRFSSYLSFKGLSDRWTKEDDDLLIKLVEEHGEGNWNKVSEIFRKRSKDQIRHRYNTLKKWRKKKPNSELMAPTRQMNAILDREKKVLDKIVSLLPDLGIDTELEINENNLLELKEKINLGLKERRGRKLGSKKVITSLDKQYYAFFRCVYPQIGGKRKSKYDTEGVHGAAQMMYNMLCFFKARINIPHNDSEIDSDCVLRNFDKYILKHLRDNKQKFECLNIQVNEPQISSDTNHMNQNPLMVLDTSATRSINLPSLQFSTVPSLDFNHTLYSSSDISFLLPPNRTTLLGFRTLLLSRRNILSNAEDEADESESQDICASSSDMSFERATTLWRERLVSLFVWPAIMSNSMPKTYDSVFKTEPLDQNVELDFPFSDDDTNEVTSVLSKTKKRSRRKKKPGRKKTIKPIEITQLPKRRKYERTGKYKLSGEVTNEHVELRSRTQ